jgi:hypothetical protein
VNKSLFNKLVESMKQHDKIARHERAPSRQFAVDVTKSYSPELKDRLTDDRAYSDATEPNRDVLARLAKKPTQ